MVDVTFVGGPADGVVEPLMPGASTHQVFIPDGKLMVLYVEDGIDSDGRIVMRATERKPYEEFFPPKTVIRAKAVAVFVSVVDPHGALVHALDAEDNTVASFQLGNENTDLKTMGGALERVPIVLADRAGLRLTSEWSERGGHPFATVAAIAEP
jgi:hypothetical protein